MKRVFSIAYIAVSLVILVYSFPRSPAFPNPPADSPQSNEPADTETTLRRAYFSDYTREDAILNYKQQFAWLPYIRLNYPPEDAQSIIRDQTRSSYLEEIVHPFRESLFINGFVPAEQKDAIIINGKQYYEKLTIRYVPTNRKPRFIYLISTLVIGYFIGVELFTLTGEYISVVKNRVRRK